MSHNTRKRGKSRGGRIGSLIRRTGKPRKWCSIFLQDFGQFCDYISRHFSVKIRDVDASVAFAVERAKMAEEHAKRNPLSEEDLGQIFEVKGPEPSIEDGELAIVKRRRPPSEDDLKEIFG